MGFPAAARVVMASVDTYLRFAEAVNRLDISDTEQKGLPELMEDVGRTGARSKTKGAIEAAGDSLRDFLGQDERAPARERRRDNG